MSINRKFTKILGDFVMSHKMSVNGALSSSVSCLSFFYLFIFNTSNDNTYIYMEEK